MARIFLTGASGFIGRAVLDALRGSEHDVTCLQRGGTGAQPDAATWITGDLLVPSSYAAALAQVDTVVHLAAVTGRAARQVHMQINADATVKLLEASVAAGIGRFIFVSSIAVKFGDAAGYHYAVAKRQAEAAVRASGLPHVILRPTIVLGPGSPIGERFRAIAGMRIMPVFGSGTVRVQPIDVSDVAALLRTVIDADTLTSEVLEVGGPDVITMEDLLRKLRARLGMTTTRVVHLPLGMIRSALGALERVSLSLAPVTAGQLAAFANDSVAEPHPFVQDRSADFKSIDAMLADIAAHA